MAMTRPPRAGPSVATAIKLIAFCTVVAALHLAQTVLLPLAIAALLAFALNPIVRRLERPLRYRPLAIGVTVACTSLLAAALLALAVGQARQFVDRTSEVRTALSNRLSTWEGASSVRRLLQDVRSVGSIESAPAAEPPPPAPVPLAPQPAPSAQPIPAPPPENPGDLIEVGGRILHFGGTVMITILLVSVLLLFQDDLRDRLVRILGVESLPLTRQTLADASQRVSRYLLAQAGINALSGLLVATALMALGVPNALLLGIITAMLRFVPYLGFITAAALAFLMAVSATTTLTVPLMVLGSFAVIEVLVAAVLEPWLYGTRTGLSLFGVVVALTFWGWLWGISGLLLAVPITVCVVLLARHFPALEPLSVLLGDAPPLLPPDRFHHRLLSNDARGARATLAPSTPDAPLHPAELDDLWLPSLRRAALEAANGRLVGSDLDGYIRTASEVLASSEPQAEPGPARVLIFTSTSRLDLLTAKLVRAAVDRPEDPARIIEPPVMLAELTGSPEVLAARAIVVITLSRASRKRANLLARTLHARVPGVPVILAAMNSRSTRASIGGISRIHSAAELFEVLSLPVPAEPQPPDPAVSSVPGAIASVAGVAVRAP